LWILIELFDDNTNTVGLLFHITQFNYKAYGGSGQPAGGLVSTNG